MPTEVAGYGSRTGWTAGLKHRVSGAMGFAAVAMLFGLSGCIPVPVVGKAAPKTGANPTPVVSHGGAAAVVEGGKRLRPPGILPPPPPPPPPPHGFAPIPDPNAPPPPVLAAKAICENGRWKGLTGQGGHRFTSQVQCARWQNSNPAAGITGRYYARQSFTHRTHNCNFVHQVFDAKFPGRRASGTVTLHMAGCVNKGITAYNGTFVLEKSQGRVAGQASGRIAPAGARSHFELRLTVTSATGALSHATGPLHVSQTWSGGRTVTGSITTG